MTVCTLGSLRNTALPIHLSQSHNHAGILEALRRPEEKHLLQSLSPAIHQLDDVNRQMIDDKYLCVRERLRLIFVVH